MDKFWDASVDKLYYYRLVATSIQRARKFAGLHPWDPVQAFWQGDAKYNLLLDDAQIYINKITRIKLNNYIDNNNHYIYSNYFDNIGLTIYLIKE